MKPPIRSYKDLIVWQRAVELFVAVTNLVRSLPMVDRLVFEVQIRRAARSIAANISEGHQRRHLGDYLRHLSFARASVAEVETDLILMEKTTSVSAVDAARCQSYADEIGKMLTMLSASLRKRRGR